jgi:hypothetical protein
MSKLCHACQEKPGTFTAKVYDPKGAAVNTPLCRDHDIELYKLGQFKFVLKYQMKINEADADVSASTDEVLGDFS